MKCYTYRNIPRFHQFSAPYYHCWSELLLARGKLHCRFPFTMSWCRRYFMAFHYRIFRSANRSITKNNHCVAPNKKHMSETHYYRRALSFYICCVEKVYPQTQLYPCMHVRRVHENWLYSHFVPFPRVDVTFFLQSSLIRNCWTFAKLHWQFHINWWLCCTRWNIDSTHYNTRRHKLINRQK